LYQNLMKKTRGCEPPRPLAVESPDGQFASCDICITHRPAADAAIWPADVIDWRHRRCGHCVSVSMTSYMTSFIGNWQL